jgi:hemerythrin superfamily protein
VNALDLLEQQHRQVEGLFKELKKARTVPQKRRLCGELAKALAVHTKLEETIFYPAVFGDETEETLRESVEEHLVAKRILADLLKMEPSDPQFMGKVSVLEEVVRHHVEEEENELFPQVRKECGDDLEVLGASLQKRNRELMKDEPVRNLPKETRSAVVQF